jgi:outer membrane protein TolC
MQRACVWLALFVLAHAGADAAAPSEPDPVRSPASVERLASAPVLRRLALIEAVLARNPSLAASWQAWVAATEEIPQASSLEDPMASLSMAPRSIGSSEARFGEVLRLAQSFPFPGTLRLRADVAEANAAAAEQRFEGVRQRLATAASFLYDDYWLVGRALEITAQHIDLLQSFQRVATSRYATGLAPQQAPIQAEVEAAHLRHRQVVLRSERRKVVARLNALLHRPARSRLPPPPDRLDVDTSTGVAVEDDPPSRPEVAAQRAEVEALRVRVDLEELRKRPDFEVTTSYNSMWGTPEHRWTVGLGLRLPLQRKRLHAAVAEAEARLAVGESTLVALTDTVAAEVESALASLEEAEHVVRLYRDRVLPAASDQVAAARAGFESGEVSMLGLIDAARNLLTAELNLEEALAGVSSARVELDRALGRMPFGLVLDPFQPDTTTLLEGERP